jgi:hypothetical protein
VLGFVISKLADHSWLSSEPQGDVRLAFASKDGIGPFQKVCWAVLRKSGQLERYEVRESGKGKRELGPPERKEVDSAEGGQTSVTFKSGSKSTKLHPLQATVPQYLGGRRALDGEWPPLMFCLAHLERPVPEPVLNAVIMELVHDDGLLVRAIPASGRDLGPEDGDRLAEALVDIFASVDRVHLLLLSLASHYFGQPGVEPGSIARENSQPTNVARLFVRRFGQGYYGRVLKPFVEYLEQAGDINLSKPALCEPIEAKDLLVSFFERIAGSEKEWPPELRHIASVIRQCCALRFNSRRCTYNALSGLFFQRFIVSVVTNPCSYDAAFKPVKMSLNDFMMKITVPFTQMATMPINQTPMDGRYASFKTWDAELSSSVYPQLRSFLDAVSQFPAEAVTYDKASREGLAAAVVYVLQRVGAQHEEFVANYKALKGDESRLQPLGWAIGSAFLNLFQAVSL